MPLATIPRRFGGVGALSSFVGSGLAFKVEIALGIGGAESGIWGPDANEGEWDLSNWSDTEGPGTLYWVDVTSRALSVVASSGRDRFESRFRTGAAIFVLDNDDGVFSPDHGSIGDVRFRPGRWIRLSGQLAGTVANPGSFVWGGGAGYVQTSRRSDDGSAGFTVEATITPIGSPGTEQMIVNDWSTNATNRGFALDLMTDGRVRLRVQDPINGAIQVVSDAAPPAGVPATIEATFDPGAVLTLSVNGIPKAGGSVVDAMETSAIDIRIGSRAADGAFQFLSEMASVLWTPVGMDPLRLNGFDVGAGGPLNGIVWNDPYGNELIGSGDVSLAGFVAPAEFVPLWTGYISAIADEYGPAGGSIRSRISASDHLGNLAIDNPPALSSPVPAELSSDRVNRILDLNGWPEEGRAPSDVGLYDVQSSELAQSRLEEIQLTAESEGGAFYQTKDGRTRFRNRDYLESERSAIPQFAIGAVGAGVQVLSTKSDWSTQRVYNDVTFARAGGSAQRVQDETSIAMYQRRTSGRNNLQNTDDTDVLFLANRFLLNFRYDKLRIEQLTVTAVDDIGAGNLLGVELADRVQCTIRNLRGWAFTIDAWINRITWRISADDWEADLVVDNVDSSDPLDRSGFVTDGFTDGFGV